MTQTTHTQSADQAIHHDLLDLLIHEHLRQRVPRFDRLWRYFRNPMHERGAADRGKPGYRMAQEQGLPARITHGSGAGMHRERVIENDIAWRIHTLVDFMFGKPVVIQSLARGPERSAKLEQFLRAVFHRNGGPNLFQDMALIGAVYGHVDVLVHVEPGAARSAAEGDVSALAEAFRLELVEAPRAVPVVNGDDYRQLDAYALHVRQPTNEVERSPLLARVRDRMFGSSNVGRRAVVERTSVWTAEVLQTYRTTNGPFGPARRLVEEQINRLGRIPVVHIQNLPQPLFYEGLSDVEPLIPLQDELNTRLSDRANRVTFQSFKMYLGKGIEQFTERPVGPGQMWSTDNLDASIQEFGGDGSNPSEEAHIRELREAMDKASGVTPVAAGLISGRVGNLTSAVALRTVLMGLIARTEKKRVTYGAGLEQVCELLLHAADVHGLLPNTPEERRIRLDWPHPLPLSEEEQLRNAKAKLDIGVPRQQILTELGYGECKPEA